MMNRLFLAATAAAAAVTTTGLAVASDRHHHHSHFGSHYHRSHGYHYGLHSYTHNRGHYGSGFGFGLSLGRSYRNYGYTTPIYNGYSYSSRNRYYSYPTTYRYSSPSCVIQSTTVVPRREVIAPQPEPQKKKVEPAPQAVPPLNDAAPHVGPTLRQPASVASLRHEYGSQQSSRQIRDASVAVSNLGPELVVPQTSSLISDNSVPFIVSSNQPVLVADKDSHPSLPPLPVRLDADASPSELIRPLVPKQMQGIELLPVADQKLALSQQTCPVTGDLLGADGKPAKVPLPGRTVVFVCCKDCVADLKRNPDRFLTNR